MESESTQSSKSQKHSGFAEICEQHYENTLNQLVTMAFTKGFKAYTWHRVKQLENETYGFYFSDLDGNWWEFQYVDVDRYDKFFAEGDRYTMDSPAAPIGPRE